MFERVEEKLKTLAVICALFGIVLGLAIWVWMINIEHGVIGFIVGACVAFTCLESCWVLYAFGEMLEQQKEMKRALESGLAKEIRIENERIAQEAADARAKEEKAERERREAENARRTQEAEAQKRAEQEKQARITEKFTWK